MIEKSFGEVLREVRKEKKMSQTALAFASELDRTYISMLERGKRQPTISTLFKLALVLEIAPVKLIERLQAKLISSPGYDDRLSQLLGNENC